MTSSSILRRREFVPRSSVADGLRALANSELIVLCHDDRIILVGCAGTATTKQLAFIVRRSTGFVQVALHERDCDRLVLPELTPSSRMASAAGYGQCVTVDASFGTTTGISGADRARTARVLADPRSVPDDFTRPGHVVPIRVDPYHFRDRRTAASAALAWTDAALPEFSGAVFADLEGISDPTSIAGLDDAEVFAQQRNIPLIISTVDSDPLQL